MYYCPHCHLGIDAGSKRCPACKYSLVADTPETPPAPRPARRFTPKPASAFSPAQKVFAGLLLAFGVSLALTMVSSGKSVRLLLLVMLFSVCAATLGASFVSARLFVQELQGREHAARKRLGKAVGRVVGWCSGAVAIVSGALGVGCLLVLARTF